MKMMRHKPTLKKACQTMKTMLDASYLHVHRSLGFVSVITSSSSSIILYTPFYKLRTQCSVKKEIYVRL